MSNKTQLQRFYWGVGRFYLTPAPSYATACKHARNASKQSTDDYNVYVEFASGSGLEMITSYNRGKINYKSPRYTRVGRYIMDNYKGTMSLDKLGVLGAIYNNDKKHGAKYALDDNR